MSLSPCSNCRFHPCCCLCYWDLPVSAMASGNTLQGCSPEFGSGTISTLAVGQVDHCSSASFFSASFSSGHFSEYSLLQQGSPKQIPPEFLLLKKPFPLQFRFRQDLAHPSISQDRDS